MKKDLQNQINHLGIATWCLVGGIVVLAVSILLLVWGNPELVSGV